MSANPSPGELLLLVPSASYRLDDLRAAAARLGVPLLVGSDRCHLVRRDRAAGMIPHA